MCHPVKSVPWHTLSLINGKQLAPQVLATKEAEDAIGRDRWMDGRTDGWMLS